ncbi:xanthine dehydrogenase family protein molybdopterin-binding subunit [Streptomyces sp. bgisy027]|uniref:xanthine dehydrogenase family protein molybdopterin-binding subunit n=1 Tax=unclassified Streptomyces TaxID=2593676 RepID=UPI003D716F23
MRDGRWLVGMGMATAYHPAQEFVSKLTVKLSADGTVPVRCGLHEIGNGAVTAQTQITADVLGVPPTAVTVRYGTSDEPTATTAAASAQTASVAADLTAACEKLKQKVLALAGKSAASPLRGHSLNDLQARDGRLYMTGRASTGETYAAILARAGRASVEVAVGADTRIGNVAGQMKMMSKVIRNDRRLVRAATGAHFCEVRVDHDTGEVRIVRWTGVFGIGTVINPKLAGSQVRGAIVMGIGLALGEETLVDPRNGRIMNPSLAEYHIPVHADVPPIDVRFLDEPDPTMPLGLIGVGQVGITGAAAAIGNAVRHATGTRLTHLPITLDQLL